MHDLLAGHTVDDAMRLQVALGKLRRASGHFCGKLLAIDPHRVQSYSKCRMRLHAKKKPQGHARAYLLRIADRLVFDRQRKAGREVTLDEENWKRIEPAGCTEDPSQSLARTEAAKELTAALDRLSPAQRRVLLLRYYGQLSFSEIAQIVECPISTVLSHCRRGLLALRKLLVENTP